MRFIDKEDVKTVFINRNELVGIKDAAKARTASNKSAGNHKNKTFMNAKDKDHSHSELVGLCAEVAVSEYLGIEIPTLVFDQKYFNQNKHNIRDVGTYEVKATHYKNGKLVLQQKHVNAESNLYTKYIFCTVDLLPEDEGASVRIVGWATPLDMTENGEELASQYNTAWYLQQQFLHPVSELKTEEVQ